MASSLFSKSSSSSPGLPELDKKTAIGISVAIAGNIIISLALNLQKLSHRRRDLKHAAQLENPAPDPTQLSRRPYPGMERVREVSGEGQEDNDPLLVEDQDGWTDSDPAIHQIPVEPESPQVQPPLLPRVTSHGSSANTPAKDRNPLLSMFSPKSRRSPPPTDVHMLPNRTSVSETTHLLSSDRGSPGSNSGIPGKRSPVASIIENGNESEYLKSKVWWAGFLLMNIGETGNFISYAFAPASVVAPLGTFALIANCFFAPLLLKERFRKVEIFGIIIAILGAVTVVLSTNTSETRLDRDALLHAISQRPFLIYSGVYIVGAIILSGLSAGPRGRDWIIIDVGLCALFGGFTVLSTKALSTLLTMEWIHIFTEWITYPVVVVLVATGIGQIKYLNRALIRFDSKTVVPTQFVLFTLSAILGSAILYGDFNKATFHQMVTFLYGCAATFGGVFMIAWSGPSDASSDEQSEHTDIEAVRPRTPGELPRLRMGSLRARNRLADDVRPTSIRRKQSSASLVGFSPAQRLLIVHTPPGVERTESWGDEGDYVTTPDSANGRRRALSWLDDERPSPQSPRRGPPSRENVATAANGGPDNVSRMASFTNPTRLVA